MQLILTELHLRYVTRNRGALGKVAIEIERKFLVLHDDWREHVLRSDELLEGIIAETELAHVRVRAQSVSPAATIKSSGTGGVRNEYEYEIDRSDAFEMIHTLCGSDVLQKKRHHIRHEGFNWIVDEYTGIMDSIIVAEVELADISTTVQLPDWVGREVSGEPAFKKINMLRMRQKKSENEIWGLRSSL